MLWLKLSWEGVREIRRSKGRTHQEIADEYGVARQTVSKVIAGELWQEAA